MNEVISLDGNVATVRLNWYCFSQNNSGGYFVEDDNQGPFVFIQAASADEANRIGFDFFDTSYCPCCGERWYEVSEYDGKDQPMIYGSHIYDHDALSGFSMRTYCKLHFYDGHVETYEFGTKPIERLPATN